MTQKLQEKTPKKAEQAQQQQYPHQNTFIDSNRKYYSIIHTEIEEPRKEVKGKFIFYFTGSTKDHLLEGIQVELDIKMSPYQCIEKLQEILSKQTIFIPKAQLLVYLPGGIPFISGHLSDIFSKKEIKAQKVIYGVLTRQIPDSILNKKCYELCNASDEKHRLIISPFCDSSERGLSDISCLLGVLNRDETKSEFILQVLSRIIHFPPFITSMKRIIENDNIVVRDVVTFCSTLFTYMRLYLPNSIDDKNLFEHCLTFCSLSSLIKNIIDDDNLPISLIEVSETKSDTKFLSDLNLGPSVYLWNADFNEKFTFHDLYLDYNAITVQIKQSIESTIIPIEPLSIRKFYTNTIVHGKDHEYLFLNQSLNKSYKYKNMIDIIDPLTCKTESKDIETFVKEQSNENDISSIIDPCFVDQIVMVNLDESRSMVYDLEGNHITPKSDKESRMTIAIQIITEFVNRNYGYRIPSIQGLVTFNDKIKLKCPLSPFVSDFELKGFKDIQPNSKPKLWDSILFSCEEIIKFRKSKPDCELYTNAKSRILVISSDEDDNSKSKIEEVVIKLLKYKISVDCICFNKKDVNKTLCAVCHITGGSAFRPENVKEALFITEQEAFLNSKCRKRSDFPLIPNNRMTVISRIKPEHITEDYINQVKENSVFDSELMNMRIMIFQQNKVHLATPSHMYSRYKDHNFSNTRKKRIMKELFLFTQIMDQNNDSYDPDIKIIPYQGDPDVWRVFLKGPEGTPYEKKWWYLSVTFPYEYPFQPPDIRFISVPLHLNISSDGKICLNSLDKCYMPSNHVIDLIQEIKEFLILPCIDLPIQIDIYLMFINERDKYEKLAKESTIKNAKDDFNEYIVSSFFNDEIPSDYEAPKSEQVPPFLISQISGKKIRKENLILASSGVYYDKDELIQFIKSNKNPVCVITGKLLTEKFDEI